MKKQTNKSLFNRIVAWLHLWPSIVSGIIVVFVCITGTIIVYGDEIMDLTAGNAKYVTPQNDRVTTTQIDQKMKEEYPNFLPSEYVFFQDPERSIRIRAFNRKERRLALFYVNPYTGEILKKDTSIYFFFVTAHLHGELLAGAVGHWLVAISTIIFVISCITGLVLWWPKKWNKVNRQQSFTIKWSGKFKRVNYDLHNVYGFYSLIFALVLGMTGLMIFFHSLMDFTVQLSGGGETGIREVLPKMDSSKTSYDMASLAYDLLEGERADKKMISTWNPDFQKLGAFVFTSGKAGLKSTENADIDVFDRYSGKKIPIETNVLKHEKAENIVWQLHLGQWWGQLGKLATFLTGIVCTSLPITGFIIWWGRRKKGKKGKKKKTSPTPSTNKRVIPKPKISKPKEVTL